MQYPTVEGKQGGDKMKKEKRRKMRCYYFQVYVPPGEKIGGYVVEANKEDAYNCIRGIIADDFGGYRGLQLYHIPRDKRVALMIAVDEEKEDIQKIAMLGSTSGCKPIKIGNTIMKKEKWLRD